MEVKSSLKFRPLSLEDEEWFYRMTYHIGISDLSFPLLLSYQEFLNIQYVHLDNDTVLLAQNDAYENRCYTILGNVREEVIRACLSLGIHQFSYVAGVQLPIFTNIPELEWKVSYDRDFSDYVFKIENFLTPRSKLMKECRNFQKNHSIDVKPLTKENWEESRAIVAEWVENQEDRSTFKFGDELDVYRHTDQLMGHDRIRGLLFYDNGQAISFLLAEERGEMMIFHFSKSIVRTAGLSIFMYRELLAYYKKKVKWVNLEEDMGFPGLQTAKQRFRPDFLLNKYTVELLKSV